MKKILPTIIILFLISFTFEISPLFSTSIFAQTCQENNCPATLQDFWEGKAFFEFQNKFTFPTDNQWAWAAVNMGTDLVVKENTWYIFTREYELREKMSEIYPYYNECSGNSTVWNGNIARIVVRKSTNKGKTWTNKTIIINPSENKPYECSALDGDAYFDSSTSTWHYVFQCLSREGKWNLCHATRRGEDPLGPFEDNAANPVIRSGNLWEKICNLPEDDCYQITQNSIFGKIGEEGTPEIVEKKEGYFYVTFHGFDNPHGYRGIAKTPDFVNWQLVNNDAIFDKYDCQPWNVPWDSNGCRGGGQASILKDGQYYYMLIEAADKNLACTPNQQWVYGLLRSPSLEATNWENLPNGKNAIIFTTKEKDSQGNTLPCGVQYARLFRDANNEIYLLVGRIGIKDKDPVTGIYLYKLKKFSPFAFYEFREGPGHKYTNSDIVSYGNLEAETSNIEWINGGSENTFILKFNGENSVVVMPNNPIFNLNSGALIIELKLLISNIPSSYSSFIAGKPGSYWSELYPNGDLCFWLKPTGDKPSYICTSINLFLEEWHNFKLVYENPEAKIYIDNVLAETKKLNIDQIETNNVPFKLGSNYSSQNGFGGSFNGLIDFIKIFNSLIPFPTPTPSPTPEEECPNGENGNLDCDSQGWINEIDLAILLLHWHTNPETPPLPPSPGNRSADIAGNDGLVNEQDLSKMLLNWVSF